MLAAIWIAWAAWVLWHYYVVPGNPFLLFDGELFPAPHWHEAARRALAGVAGASAVTMAAWGVGAHLLRFADVPFTGRLERASFALATGFAALSFALLGLAAVGLYRPAVLIGFVGAGVLAAFASPASARMPPGDESTVWPRTSAGVLFVSIAAVATMFAFVGALAPETEYDALWYHLWMPQQWLAAGRPVDLLHEYPSLNPQTWELLFGAAMTIGGPVAARLLHFICLPLLGLATARLTAVALPGRPDAPAAAAALVVVSPTVIWEATTAYVDLALAWYVALAVYALVRYTQTNRLAWLAMSAGTIGVAMAIKHLGLVAFAIVGIALAVMEFRRTTVRRALKTCALFAAIAFLLPAPYYARAYVASGNPVFPDLYGVFGANPPERWDELTEEALGRFKQHFGRERTAANLVSLPWDVTVHGARYGGSAGPLFLLLAPVGLLAGPFLRWMLAGCALYVLVWASPISSFQFRFLVPILPFLAVAAAAGLQQLPRAATLVVVPLLLLNLPPFTEWHEGDRQGWTGWLTHVVREMPLRVIIGSESERDYLARNIRTFAAWQYANAKVPEDARVLTFSGGDHLYSRRQRLSSDTPAARPATWDEEAGQEARAVDAARELGITHIMIDVRQLSEGPVTRLAIVSRTARECCLEEIYNDGRSVLYRVR